MEKVAYLLWSPPTRSPDQFRERLLASVPTQFGRLGARRVKVCVTDSAVDAGAGLHLGAHRPHALVTWWTDSSFDDRGCVDILASVTDRIAGYLVSESEPLRYAKRSRPGTRCDGFTAVGCIEPADGLSLEEFRARWFGPHRATAIETQHTFSYVRNEVVRPLTDGAPPWAGIVEEMFPLAALDDAHAFFDAVDDPERFATNTRRMMDSVSSFIALDRVESHPMSEYRF